MSEQQKLERGLGLLEATSLNMTFMVGIGPFVVIPIVIKSMGGPGSLFAWLAGALLALSDGCIWAELGAAMPQAGGSYVYLREAYGAERWGRLLSFLFIWQTLFQGPLSIASGALGFADYSTYLTGKSARVAAALAALGSHGRNVVAAMVVLLVVALLYRRITEVGRISVVFSAIVIATILWIIFGGATHFVPGRVFDFSGRPWNSSWLLFAALGHGTVQTVYSYLGYYNVCNLGGEMKTPEKNIPRAIFISILGITALYLAMQTSILSVIPWREAAESKFIASTFIERAVRQPVGDPGHGADPGHGDGQRVCGDARLFASALRCRSRRQFPANLRPPASDEAFSVRLSAGSGRERRSFSASRSASARRFAPSWRCAASSNLSPKGWG